MNELKKIKAVFFGTSDFAVPILSVVAENLNLMAVVTQPDRPVGRKQEIIASPVKSAAQSMPAKIFQFDSLKSEKALTQLKELGAELFIVAAYGKIIPQSILDLPAKGSINVHGSILPKYRGASPIHAALLNGDTSTGNTITIMDAQMDHGPILATSEVSIDPNDDFKSLEKKMSEDGARLLIETLSGYFSGKIIPHEQDHEAATYTKLISKEDGIIDWSSSASAILNQWRAYKYWPGVFTYFNDKSGKNLKLSLNEIKPTDDISSVESGTMSFDNSRIVIGCGSGSIEVLSLTPEGKKNMPASQFINGYRFLDGVKLIGKAE